MTHAAVAAICNEFEIEIIGKSRYPEPGQTRAVATLDRILQNYGEGHLRLVLATLMETKGGGGIIDEVSAWAVSDLVRACAAWVEDRTSEWLGAWDRLPMGPYMYVIGELGGTVSRRAALAGLCYAFLRDVLSPDEGLAKPVRPQRSRGILLIEQTHSLAPEDSDVLDLTIDRGRHYSPDEKRAIGAQILKAKSQLSHGHFGPWLKKRGISAHLAHASMQLARAV